MCNGAESAEEFCLNGSDNGCDTGGTAEPA